MFLEKKGLVADWTSRWRHNERDDVSNHQRLYCLLSCLFRRKSKKTSQLRAIGLCEGNWPVTDGFHSQRSVTRKKLPFDDVIMRYRLCVLLTWQYRHFDEVFDTDCTLSCSDYNFRFSTCVLSVIIIRISSTSIDIIGMLFNVSWLIVALHVLIY